jgi:hypothetical protein
MCPYYLDGDLAGSVRARREGACSWIRPVIPVATRAYRVRVAVAAVQFSRAVREGCTRADRHEGRRRASGLSKLNSMHGLELVGMTRDARSAPAARVCGTAAGPARFGRRARPHGRRPALPDPLATEVASGAGGAVPYGHRVGAP